MRRVLTSGEGAQDVVVQESRILFSLRCQQVLPLLAAFLVGSALWLVTAYAAGGSLLSLMQFCRPHVCPLPCADPPRPTPFRPRGSLFILGLSPPNRAPAFCPAIPRPSPPLSSAPLLAASRHIAG